jgi:hypothetical protein
VPYARLSLKVATPQGDLLTRSFPSGEVPTLMVGDLNGAGGLYTYELRLAPALDAGAQAALAAAADDPEARLRVADRLRAEGKLPAVTTLGGSFAILEGRFVTPAMETGEPAAASHSPSGAVAPNDVVHADDVIITGSECVGFDCLTDGSENFGFDTIKLKENNLRLYFDDTSATAGFAANDWRLIANDSASGGANYFAIEDSTAARIPFRIEAGAPNNSLYVRDTGRIGLGTNVPVTKLHLVLGDTPAIRLEQDASSGWTPQVWDMAGNESNFFVRDVTGGSKLPFRIQPGSPTNSITIKADGKVGLGTWSPAYAVELEKTGENAVYAADRTDGATALMVAGTTSVQFGSGTNHNVELVVNNTPVMTLNSLGNATLQGVLSEYSDANAKENFAAVNVDEVLGRLSGIPIMTWNYRSDDPSARHMGPMAQDFYAAFSLGQDNLHIASLDVNGVSLAAIQALSKITADQKGQIARLEADNTALQQKVDGLEARLASLEQAVASPKPVSSSGPASWSLVLVAVVAVGLMQAGPALYRRLKVI